ncbi:MAG: hypothetical protein E7005_02265 [Alphaproteobacteria bacterium]|nr:hypothetical protein [Alphaproteobacteria bacterium]
MTKHNLIETFFSVPQEYLDFFLTLKKSLRASPDGKCIAVLEKVQLENVEGRCYKYTLSYGEKYIGDYLKFFKPSLENIQKFNEGCKILADRLEIYIETDDISKVPENPPAFGDLTQIVE